MHYNLVQDVFGHSVVVNFLYDNKKNVMLHARNNFSLL